METQKKDPSFPYFKRKWKKQLKDISAVLNLLHTYPQVLKELMLDDLITSDELLQQQRDWVWLCSKLGGEEREFHRAHWVPIKRGSLDYFIDLSDQHYPIIGTSFLFSKENEYHKINFFDSVNELLNLCDSDVNFSGICQAYNDEWFRYHCHQIYSK